MFRAGKRAGRVDMYIEGRRERALSCRIDDRKQVRCAFADAYQGFFHVHGRIPTPAELCFQTLQDALHTLHRLPDKEKSLLRGPPSLWPTIPADEEAKKRIIDELLQAISGGTLCHDQAACTPRELSNMEAVLMEVFPKAVVGKNPTRDWNILCSLALKKSRGPTLARKFGMSKQAIYKIRDGQLAAIARRLRDLMPDDAGYPVAA